MNKLKTFFIELRKKHIFLFIAIILSFIFSIIPFTYCFMTFFLENKLIAYLFLLPFIILLFFSILSTFLYEKYPKTATIISFIINAFIIFIIQIFIGSIFIILSYEFNIESVSNNPKYYTNILKYFPQENIIQFPKRIPCNAKNVQLYSEIFSFFGSQEIVLKFDADKQYIENELKKYKFKSKETPQHYAFSTMGGENIKIDDFTLYVIDGGLDRWAKNYGIGVNKDFNQILYYYTNPD